MPPDLFPVMMKLAGRRVLVVGAGKVAIRKVRDLLPCGATILVVAPRVDAAIRNLASAGRLRIQQREFHPDDIVGTVLVFVATDDPSVNRLVVRSARARGVPVNAVDQPELCDFYLASVVRRGPLLLAVSSGGTSPALAATLARELGANLEESLEQYLALLSEARAETRRLFPNDPEKRFALNRSLVRTNARWLVSAGNIDAARRALWKVIHAS